MKTVQELFEEWKVVRNKCVNYARAGVDDEMNLEMYDKHSVLYDRKKEIEGLINSMGYDIEDGEKPYSFELKKIAR